MAQILWEWGLDQFACPINGANLGPNPCQWPSRSANKKKAGFFPIKTADLRVGRERRENNLRLGFIRSVNPVQPDRGSVSLIM
jgi:hypothetical protein